MAKSKPQRSEQSGQMPPELAMAYWKENLRIIFSLLGVWAFVTFVAGFLLAGTFNTIPFFNVPLSFWIVQQGAIMIYVILIFVYAKLMDRLDAKYNVNE